MQRVIGLFVGGLCFALCSSCSVFMAANQPASKDISVLSEGIPQDRVRAEFGSPIWEGEENGTKVELYKFKNGYSKGAKAGRAVGHLVADVFTCGLWEVVGTPTEIAFDGKDCTAKVFYNENNCVNRVVITEQ